MFMLIEMAATLTLTAVILEAFIVWRYRWLLLLFKRRKLLGVAFSLVLSWLIGEAFGATGLVIMVAAVASTVVTATIYGTGAVLAIEPLLAVLRGAA
jgi:hypothetical protein